MTAPGTERRGVGFRKVTLFALDGNGDVLPTGTTAYEGLEIVGAKALTLDEPEPRVITHTGDDRVLDVDSLPPSEAMTGELQISGVDDDFDDLVTDRISVTVGNLRVMGMGTNVDGNENQVGVLAYRQTLDGDGARKWDARIIPKCLLIPRPSGFDETPEVHRYAVRPQMSGKHIWGTSFASGTEGFTRAQVLRMVSNYQPKLVGFVASGGEKDYALPTASPAVSSDEINVWVGGVLQTTGVTKATTQIQFAATPATDAVILVLYGLA
jgi:hypothetical protein